MTKRKVPSVTYNEPSYTSSSTCGGCGTTVVYGAGFEPWTNPGPLDMGTTLFTSTKLSDICRSEKEVRELLSKLLLWLSGMGEYPDEVRVILSPEIIGLPEEDADDLIKSPERAAVQVLRWILGEVELEED